MKANAPPSTEAIRDRYDRLTSGLDAIFGEHIHHGFWDRAASVAEAQRRLIERVASQARIPPGSRVLDIGCGTGGSSRWLAETLDCSVLGITISPVEVRIATEKAHAAGLSARAQFQVMDANELDLPPSSFDAVWVVETSEHLEDKRPFMENCARVLKPGGVFALSACVAVGEPADRQSELLAKVCRVLLLPSLATLAQYREWIREAGLSEVQAEDVTLHVAETWWRYAEAFRAAGARRPTPESGETEARKFIQLLTTMRAAYREGALHYGIFSARRA
ncbi:MAG: methyltransferase domain-containing protein [Chthoniobacterales bacterium]